jgi:hypothetical protein
MEFPLEHRYYRYSYYLKKKFGEKVYKVSVDAGFTCPTRDGTLGTTGCIYCNNASFSPADRKVETIDTQIEQGINHLKKRGINKFLVYFQSYTNTYAPPAKLRKIYSTALEYEGVVGICIGTRPDCIDGEVLNLLDAFNKKTYVSLEIGIESVYDKTLQWAKRGHDFTTARRVIKKIKQKDIHVSGHYILGFPTESREEMLASAAEINKLNIDAIKLHHLHIVKNTELANIYKKSPFKLFTAEEWIDFVVEYLEHLKSDIVIQRLMGDARGETLIAPQWQMNKLEILNAIKKKLAGEDSYQGAKTE